MQYLLNEKEYQEYMALKEAQKVKEQPLKLKRRQQPIFDFFIKGGTVADCVRLTGYCNQTVYRTLSFIKEQGYITLEFGGGVIKLEKRK